MAKQGFEVAAGDEGIKELATLYTAAFKRGDNRIAGVAEAAAFRVASAEGALLQAEALRRFAQRAV